MLHVLLYQPEIPPNTGNVIRLCANSGASLHLIEPLGFTMEDRQLRRAGLDYHEWARVRRHPDLATALDAVRPGRVFAMSTRGRKNVFSGRFAVGDALLFGPETRGLPETVLNALPAAQVLRLPMRPGNRSLNLSNAVAVCVYEAWRQLDFVGAAE
ncbi:tRNA (cytidine(34)-2'-O)-methyltransferase [Methylonatrum kenyense]|uniref:tRNA (cytidine(34)-2'-O)-methyltransferase n=1 Tax=Methylonatrum kenyense TaxID=455253 RepID=UPI0020C120B4|nr:tRNA (cytidine(34)-2'-O)-methyltransferase [Methylonatrum kenyense]